MRIFRASKHVSGLKKIGWLVKRKARRRMARASRRKNRK